MYIKYDLVWFGFMAYWAEGLVNMIRAMWNAIVGDTSSNPGRGSRIWTRVTDDNDYTMGTSTIQPLRSGRIWHNVNSLAEFNRFEFRVFLLQD